MKEYIIKVPDEADEIVAAVIEKFGVKATEIKKRKNAVKAVPKNKRAVSKKKIDHTYLFNKWKDFDIDPKKLREQSW